MSYESFANLVEKMRGAQRTYFRERTVRSLELAKELERDVDGEVRRIKNPQKMFDFVPMGGAK